MPKIDNFFQIDKEKREKFKLNQKWKLRQYYKSYKISKILREYYEENAQIFWNVQTHKVDSRRNKKSE